MNRVVPVLHNAEDDVSTVHRDQGLSIEHNLKAMHLIEPTLRSEESSVFHSRDEQRLNLSKTTGET